MQTLLRNTLCYELISIFVLINSIVLSRMNAKSYVCENRIVRQITPTNFSPLYLTLSEVILLAMKNIVSNIYTINNVITYNICEHLYGLKERTHKEWRLLRMSKISALYTSIQQR